MAKFFPSKDSVFQLTNTTSDLNDMSPYILSIDGLPGVRELIEVTALGSSGREFIPGLENVVITLELQWSDDALVGPDKVLGPLRQHTSAVAFDFGPEGKSTGDIKYSGTCWVRNFTVPVRMGDKVTARAELQVEGTVTREVY